MHSLRNIKFNKKEIIIHPGEYYSSAEDIVISTILGSCISVVLYDEREKRGGLNHFLLPRTGKMEEEKGIEEKNARYGVHAMEVLINDLMKMGSDKSSLTAKVFGGAAMFTDMRNEKGVGHINILFAMQFLEREGIPVVASDTGEESGRKIFFFPRTGRVLLRKIHSRKKMQDLKKQDEGFQKKVLEEEKDGGIVLF